MRASEQFKEINISPLLTNITEKKQNSVCQFQSSSGHPEIYGAYIAPFLAQ